MNRETGSARMGKAGTLGNGFYTETCGMTGQCSRVSVFVSIGDAKGSCSRRKELGKEVCLTITNGSVYNSSGHLVILLYRCRSV